MESLKVRRRGEPEEKCLRCVRPHWLYSGHHPVMCVMWRDEVLPVRQDPIFSPASYAQPPFSRNLCSLIQFQTLLPLPTEYETSTQVGQCDARAAVHRGARSTGAESCCGQ